MRSLYLQCATGISGDMFLGAMGDLGLDISELQELFAGAGLEIELSVRSAESAGIAGSKLEVGGEAQRQLRHLPEIEQILDRLPVSEAVRERSRGAFRRLAQVEAKAHNTDIERVHFHEVGAVDTLVDVVGAFWALEQLDARQVVCSELPWFEGSVETEHGTLSLPAPATLELLRNKPVYPSRFRREIITPTGALILDQAADFFQEGFSGQVLASGLGCGDMDLGDTPNCLRAVLFNTQDGDRERVTILESNLDHLTGEEIGALFEDLFQAGALDVIYFPGVMKKNRPGGMLQVMVRPDLAADMERVLLRQTMTLGIRRRDTERLVLPRETGRMETPWGTVETKDVPSESGGGIRRPEFEALRRLARKTGYSPAELRYLLQGGDGG
jgi:uncharacterized protein (TIGR00299 family) protein